MHRAARRKFVTTSEVRGFRLPAWTVFVAGVVAAFGLALYVEPYGGRLNLQLLILDSTAAAVAWIAIVIARLARRRS